MNKTACSSDSRPVHQASCPLWTRRRAALTAGLFIRQAARYEQDGVQLWQQACSSGKQLALSKTASSSDSRPVHQASSLHWARRQVAQTGGRFIRQAARCEQDGKQLRQEACLSGKLPAVNKTASSSDRRPVYQASCPLWTRRQVAQTGGLFIRQAARCEDGK